jgi:hypothetical protein
MAAALPLQKDESAARPVLTSQQEAQAKDAGERDQVSAQIPPHARLLGLLDVPDGVHGVPELDHDAKGGHQQQQNTSDGGETAGLL